MDAGVNLMNVISFVLSVSLYDVHEDALLMVFSVPHCVIESSSSNKLLVYIINLILSVGDPPNTEENFGIKVLVTLSKDQH